MGSTAGRDAEGIERREITETDAFSLTGSSDIYSLGCVLYECLVGQPPFTGRTPQAIIARKSLEDAPSLRVVRSTVPIGMERAILRALEKTPADRFASAREFVEALEQTIEPDRTLSTTGRMWAWIGAVVALAVAPYCEACTLALPF